MGRSERLEIIPLGGLGEFGMNLMVYRHGTDCLVVDAGMMFPGAEHLGVDVVVPNMEFLDSCGTIHGVVLTHGHEDHIGALPFLLAAHDVPAFGTPYTIALVRERLAEHALPRKPDLRPLDPDGERIRLGPFGIEGIPVTHSIPHSLLLVLRTPVGTVVHTADFKLDPWPVVGSGTDLARLARLGKEGVLALLSDSTNADRPGMTPGERSVRPALQRIVRSARGRVFLTTFSSNIPRLKQAVEVAVESGRKVAVVGSSMRTHVEVAERLGLLRIPAGSRVDAETAMDLPPDRCLVLVTGSQGEPASALARIAVDDHREAYVERGDRVIHSARTIPGNEKAVGRMVNHLLRRGAEVVLETDAPVHVSGHPAADELRLLLHLLAPRYLVPIHGEFRQLDAHARIGVDAGLDPARVALLDSGDVLAVDETSIERVDRVPVGQVFLDASLDRVDFDVLRDRRKIAGDGIVVAVLALDRATGRLNGEPEIATRGFAAEGDARDLVREAGAAVAAALEETTVEQRSDEGLLKSLVQSELKRFLRRRTQKRPLIIPVLLEL